MQEKTFRISNLHTTEDAEKLTEAMLHVWGISQAEASSQHKTVSIMFDERMASPADFEQAVREAGFELMSE
ncbi:heavy-metal-associated domain-containing protein [Mesobacillus jeotgali]|uniref:Heavy-metal-associated domain-containing protein n=1 Tax=Mesobacillus jeotgali TaxID=129985 RepID=A0ABY9VMB0_9BACI|nr:heavy-metal-associated domain-containing protein [Mesobacillus jeotgali]WNF24988.1 heavy-metal-associated domain-containing protein [Mesobacillus jeotgali]